MILRTQKQIYQVKFGLKGLILLNQISNNLVDQDNLDLSLLLYCGLVSHYPFISFEEVQHIIQECNLSSLPNPPFLSFLQIQELYTKAVGEVGIAPTEFLQMTPEEIELAYEGYLRRKETEANLFKIAFVSENEELIRLTEDKGYIIGSMEEREQALKCLKERTLQNEL